MTGVQIGVAGNAGAALWVPELLLRAANRADWSPVRVLYDQRIQVASSGSRRTVEAVTESLADAIENIAPSYASMQSELPEDALAVFADVGRRELLDLDLRREYYAGAYLDAADAAVGGPRRRPAPYEAVVETSRRRRDAQTLRAALRSTATSAMLVGSVNYGPSFNVRGNRHGSAASDLDVIVVIERTRVLDGLVAGLTALPGVAASDIDCFIRRACFFANYLDNGKTVFSQKVRVWTNGPSDPVLPAGVAPADYLLSLHAMTLPTLNYLLVSLTPKLDKDMVGARRTLRDYRDARTSRQDDLRNFAGHLHSAGLGTEPTQDGWLTYSRVYHFDDSGYYFPGFHQTMFLPPPEVLWDNLDIQPKVNEFQCKLAGRLREETRKRGPALLRASNCHVRLDDFTPSMIKIMDAHYSGM